MLRRSYNFIAMLLLLHIFTFNANSQILPDKNLLKKPIIVLKASSNFSFAARNQSSAFERKKLPDGFTDNRYKNSYGGINSSKLYIKSYATTESNLKYGVITKLESEISSDQNRGMLGLDEAFAFLKSPYGRFEIGNSVAVNQKMKVGPARLAKGNGGINGNYLKYVNFPVLNEGSSNSNIKLPSFILVAQSPIGHGGYAQGFYDNNFNKNRLKILRNGSFNGAEDALKINYYTPRFGGLQAGTSYTYDSSVNGISTSVFGNESTTTKDIFSFGVNYFDSFDNIRYAISATAENGKVKQSKISTVRKSNLSSYDIAATVSYFGFSFASSYGSWGKSLQSKSGEDIYSCNYDSNISLSSQNCSSNSSSNNKASYYTLGASYEFGPFGASITSLKSHFQKNIYQAISLDIDYKLRRGLIPYFEITHFEFKSNQVQASDISSDQIQDNKGFVAMTGFFLSF